MYNRVYYIKSCKTHIQKRSYLFSFSHFLPKEMYWVFFQSKNVLPFSNLFEPKANLILQNFAQTLLYFFEFIFQEFFPFFIWLIPPNYFISSSLKKRYSVKSNTTALNCQWKAGLKWVKSAIMHELYKVWPFVPKCV